MGSHFILFVTAASLLLGACGSNVEESADTPISAVEESADTPISVVEEPADARVSVVEEPAGAPISTAKLADRIQAGSPPLILDVRSSKEYGRGHIPGAINIPHDELPTRMAELRVAKSDEIVVHCNRGSRAKLAEVTLREGGYSNVRWLDGQWKGWNEAKLPTE